jgi:hypothetical protein
LRIRAEALLTITFDPGSVVTVLAFKRVLGFMTPVQIRQSVTASAMRIEKRDVGNSEQQFRPQVGRAPPNLQGGNKTPNR